jgi:hypothetical protein
MGQVQQRHGQIVVAKVMDQTFDATLQVGREFVSCERFALSTVS